MRKITVVAATLFLAVFALAGQASAIALTGGFAIAGPFEWVSNVSCVGNTVATCPSVALGTANGLDFRIFGTNTPSPGVAGTAIVTDSSGSFIALAPVLSLVSIRDISYLGLGTAAFPFPPVLTFETTSGGVTIDLTSFTKVETTCNAGCTVIDTVNPPSILIQGLATFHSGTDVTFGTFSMQGGQVSTNFSFAAQNGTTVPEPATLMLLGLGLSGLAVAGRLKKR
jgi:hypothetical protein